MVRRAAEVEREPVPLRVERPREVGGDRAVADAQRELLPAEDVDGHDQRLRQPDVGDGVARRRSRRRRSGGDRRRQHVACMKPKMRVREGAGRTWPPG